MSLVPRNFFHHVGFLLLIVAARSTASAASSAVIPLKSTNYGTSLNIEVEIGDQTFNVIPDSGSADLWVFGKDWKCYIGRPVPTGAPEPHEKCFTGNKEYTPSSTFKPIDYAWLGEHYGSGNVYGTLGYENIKVGSIAIEGQEMGVVNASTSWEDGFGSGIMGLGYPTIVQIHPENYTKEDALSLLQDRLIYPTVLTRMAKQGVEPYFSMALERTPLDAVTGFGGYLGFGTLPPVAHEEFVTTPVEITKSIPASFTNGTRKITEWAINVEAVTWDGKTNSQPFQVVVDSANWLFVLPEETANKINAAFDPPGKLSPIPYQGQAYYAVSCDATPPANFGIQIAGKMFNIDSRDMIWKGPDGKTCYSSVAPVIPAAGITLAFLGDEFLKNVVAVFDYGKNEMRFAARVNNGSSGPTGPAHASPNAAQSLSTLALPIILFIVGIVGAFT